MDLPEVLQKPHYRALFISDVHLGTRSCKAAYLKDFLKSVNADTIYLVGDIVDGWSLKGSWYWPAEHNDIVRVLMKKARKSRVVYIPGNHDEALREFLPLSLGSIEVDTHAVHSTADGKRYIVLHGDIFDAFVSGMKSWAFIGSALYDLIISLNNIHHWALGKLGMKYWSLADWLKTHAREAMKAIGKYEAACVKYAKTKGYAGCITGHIHHAALKDVDGTTYANCGDWVESCTAIAEMADGSLKLIDYKQEFLE